MYWLGFVGYLLCGIKPVGGVCVLVGEGATWGVGTVAERESGIGRGRKSGWDLGRCGELEEDVRRGGDEACGACGVGHIASVR